MNNNNFHETIETIWEYCTSNNRLCPKPIKWRDLFVMLKDKKQIPSGGWEPSLPLILGAWGNTMPIEKLWRFREHIQWAFDHNQLDEVGRYLRSLSENDWTHFGEI